MSWNRDGIDEGNSVAFVRYRCNCGRTMVTCGSPPSTPCACSQPARQPAGAMRKKR